VKTTTFRSLVILSALAFLGASASLARELTFEQRVQAQEAIERVYYSHQIGATRPFEEAVPRGVLEQKVHTYLKQSAALEQFWHTPVTAEMLRGEMDRIIRDTKMPERLGQIYAALENDTFVIQECLARNSLVERLTRNFFATDERIHNEVRSEAEEMRVRLMSGALDIRSEESHRRIETYSLGNQGSGIIMPSRMSLGAIGNSNEERHLGLGTIDFERVRESVGAKVGEIGPVMDEPDAFRIRVLLLNQNTRIQVATYSFLKRTWWSWWDSNQAGFNEESVESVAHTNSIPQLDALRQPRVSSDACIPADSWRSGSLDALPSMRTAHTAVWTGSLMIVWGGVDRRTNQQMNSGGRYDPITDSWSSMTTENVPDGRSFHSAVWTGTVMIVWGGVSDEFPYVHNTGGSYDPVLDKWESTSVVNAPSGRFHHIAVWTGQFMLVWGGRFENEFFSSGGRFDPATNTWNPISELNAPSSRESAGAVWTGEFVLIWGGFHTNSYYPDQSNPYDGGRYNPATDTWSAMSTEGAPQPRSAHTAIWTGSVMVVWGGEWLDPNYFYRALNSGGRYDPAQNRWFPLAALGAPSPRKDHSAVWTGSEMILWGGNALIPGPGFIPNLLDGARYDPVEDRWATVSTSNAPAGRAEHVAVWTGNLMIVWGGLIGKYGPMTNSGARYDPRTDSWTPTAQANVPAPRQLHTAVWTGNQMVVWGGETYALAGEFTNAKYDPLLDVWISISHSGMPTGRSLHTAVWTGDWMIVWGGAIPIDGVTATGGRYDPLGDVWSPTSTVNAPVPRAYHTAIWTGKKMVVWGGLNYPYYNFYNTGGQYDPSTDTWQATSVVGAPTLRSNHSAVWSGSRMIVWGGYNHTERFPTTGGLYDPMEDKWNPMSTANMPRPRYSHSAIWAGSRMIVWGGQIDADVAAVRDGALYDPSTDTWSPTSMAGAPLGRTGHTAVWTGKEMIVWGGSREDVGARYDPVEDQWSSLSSFKAPTSRRNHSAVWTGDSMIVWGGEEIVELYRTPVQASGGRYFPQATGQVLGAQAGTDKVVECAAQAGTQVGLTGVGTSCDPSASLSYMWRGPFPEGEGVVVGANPTVTLPLGGHNLILHVDDGEGHSAEDEIVVTVRDTTPPDLTCPIVAVTECSSAAGADVVVPPAVVVDSCDANPIVSDSHVISEANASGIYPLGSTEVTMTAMDASGNSASCAFPVNVQDTTPPMISLALSPTVLWPPNHRMMDVVAPVTATDTCSSSSVVLSTIISSEPDDATGLNDGNTTGDIQGASVGSADFDFQLRAEREGGGEGRIYQVTYSAVDSFGNRSSANSFVLVPHDQGGGTEPVIVSAEDGVNGTILGWNPVPDANSYKVIRGRTAELHEAGSFIDLGTVACLLPDSTGVNAPGCRDPEIPPLGQAFFYLVSYNDGLESGYGSDTASKPRVKTAGGCE
jgi:N-acetylneuraminic acid mutarotase